MITDPKTPKSNRTIVMPDFLAIEMENFIKSIYGIKMNDRIYHSKVIFITKWIGEQNLQE